MLKFKLYDLCIRVSKLTIEGIFNPKIDVIGQIEKMIDDFMADMKETL